MAFWYPYHLGMNYPGTDVLTTFGPGLIALFGLVMLWSFIWKGLALWKAGNNKQLPWFIVLLVVNTLGMLEIVYLLWFQKKRAQKVVQEIPKKKRR